MSGKYTGIIVGLFLISISLLLFEIEGKINRPEITIYLISAVLTIGIVFTVHSFLKRKDRNKQQEH